MKYRLKKTRLFRIFFIACGLVLLILVCTMMFRVDKEEYIENKIIKQEPSDGLDQSVLRLVFFQFQNQMKTPFAGQGFNCLIVCIAISRVRSSYSFFVYFSVALRVWQCRFSAHFRWKLTRMDNLRSISTTKQKAMRNSRVRENRLVLWRVNVCKNKLRRNEPL